MRNVFFRRWNLVDGQFRPEHQRVAVLHHVGPHPVVGRQTRHFRYEKKHAFLQTILNLRRVLASISHVMCFAFLQAAFTPGCRRCSAWASWRPTARTGPSTTSRSSREGFSTRSNAVKDPCIVQIFRYFKIELHQYCPFSLYDFL